MRRAAHGCICLNARAYNIRWLRARFVYVCAFDASLFACAPGCGGRGRARRRGAPPQPSPPSAFAAAGTAATATAAASSASAAAVNGAVTAPEPMPSISAAIDEAWHSRVQWSTLLV
ncbi:hypothetical protein LCGC14_1791450, partial [marine sediment metagenome]